MHERECLAAKPLFRVIRRFFAYQVLTWSGSVMTAVFPDGSIP
jgi:hypothetical protein